MLETTRKKAFGARPDEPEYAVLPDMNAPATNQYGKKVTLVTDNDPLVGKSLNINNDDSISTNPDRYKQHGFYFNADNCIACHACESACSEKNDLSPHLAFRSVGYVEGGTYPDYRRLNVSMACNHCDDPVCLKGCPTRAYTKFAEYGAVLQDPDICFGCGYCTWVCPYNAPQLDPVNGQVEKCNMCVDRLEAGLKPACVSACLAGALDFGVIDTKPANRDQLALSIPGFPDPDITHPNIRFQQKKPIPDEMKRTDSMPLAYKRDPQNDNGYKPEVSISWPDKHWSIRKLRSREDPLVLFTLISQAVIGAFMVLFLGKVFGVEVFTTLGQGAVYSGMLSGLVAFETFALFISTMHLGKPVRFYRAFNNLRYSPVSREVAGLSIFYNGLLVYTVLHTFPGLFSWLPADALKTITTFAGWLTVIAGPLAIYFMHAIYRIEARPFWNHWQVLTDFFGHTLTLGGLTVGIIFGVGLFETGEDFAPLLKSLSWPIIIGMVMTGIGLMYHARDMKRRGGEGAASHQQQLTAFGKTYMLRNIGIILSLALIASLALTDTSGGIGLTGWLIAATVIILTAIIGRALFYVLVMPTTMPGSFFWRNKGFQEHALETGLASATQAGIITNSH